MKIGCRAQCRNYRLSEDGKFFLEIGDQENFKSFLTLKNELRTPPPPEPYKNIELQTHELGSTQHQSR